MADDTGTGAKKSSLYSRIYAREIASGCANPIFRSQLAAANQIDTAERREFALCCGRMGFSSLLGCRFHIRKSRMQTADARRQQALRHLGKRSGSRRTELSSYFVLLGRRDLLSVSTSRLLALDSFPNPTNESFSRIIPISRIS